MTSIHVAVKRVALSCLLTLRQSSTRQQQRWLLRTRFSLFLVMSAAVIIFSLFYLAVIHHQGNYQHRQHLIYPQVMTTTTLNEDDQQMAVIAARSNASSDEIHLVLHLPAPMDNNVEDVMLTIRNNLTSDAASSDEPKEKSTPTSSSSLFKSSCSRSADLRGPQQKIIGYSIYGDLSIKQKAGRYLEPLRKTIKALPTLYPGWIMRIHHNLKKEEHENSSWKILLKAVDFASHVDLCNVTEISANRQLGKATMTAMLWRWLPVLDDLVDMFMSRDTDSMILAREQDAVAEWLASNKTFHIMRDHPAHCIVMLGGLWGVKLAAARPKITAAFESLFRKEKNYSNLYFQDQKLLNKYIWPLASTNHMAHDSFCCTKFKGSGTRSTRPFPSQRSARMEFVGQIQQKNQIIKSPCPHQCRPLNVKPDWKYC